MHIKLPADFVDHIRPMVREILAPDSLARGLMSANRKNNGEDPEKYKPGILERFEKNSVSAAKRMHESAARISRTAR